jgi:GNAT superfamily N-acetyltransferase
MQDRPVEARRGEFRISTDRGQLPLDDAHALLRATYWAATLPREVLERAVANSVCFGVYHGAQLVGFGRAVSDLATYAYLADVVVAEAYRGLGRWLVECVLAHPDLQGLRRIALFTREAQALYAPFGFGPAPEGAVYMELRAPNTPGHA